MLLAPCPCSKINSVRLGGRGEPRCGLIDGRTTLSPSVAGGTTARQDEARPPSSTFPLEERRASPTGEACPPSILPLGAAGNVRPRMDNLVQEISGLLAM